MTPFAPATGHLATRQSIVSLPPSYQSLQPGPGTEDSPPPFIPAIQSSENVTVFDPPLTVLSSTQIAPSSLLAVSSNPHIDISGIPLTPPSSEMRGSTCVVSGSQDTSQGGEGVNGIWVSTTLSRHIVPSPFALSPLVPVRRARATAVEAQSAERNIHNAPTHSPAELQASANRDPLTASTTGGGGGGNGALDDYVLVQPEPGFEILRPRPTKNIEFTFSPVGTNAMLLLPPLEEGDSRPRYYITVIQDCFMPLSHITTVYRGTNESAPRVGEFEMGISTSPGYLRMENRPLESLLNVLEKKGPPKKNGEWTWLLRTDSSHPLRLIWNCNVIPFVCTAQPSSSIGVKSDEIVAWFTPLNTKKQTPVALRRLLITPNGQMLFDNIVMSILAVQRRILTPWPYNFEAQHRRKTQTQQFLRNSIYSLEYEITPSTIQQLHELSL